MEKKSERIIIRLTKEELAKLQEIAKTEEKTISDVIRGFIKFRANHYQKKSVVDVPVVEASKKEKNPLYDFDWLNKSEEATNEELYERLCSKLN